MLGEPGQRSAEGHRKRRGALLFVQSAAVMRIDLNADVGEAPPGHTSNDSELMSVVTSVSVAAGVHAGDARSIRATVRLAREFGVAVGAHPSLDDREGFGRRECEVDPFNVERLVVEQIVAVASAAADEGIELQHVKPHGALYNMAARDPQLAAAVARAVAIFDRRLSLFGPPGSALIDAGRAAGLRTISEAFVDRAYAADGSLIPRTSPGAVITDQNVVVDRALRLVLERTVVAVDGATVPIEAETICIHGDTAGAAMLAAAVLDALTAAHVVVRAPGRV